MKHTSCLLLVYAYAAIVYGLPKKRETQQIVQPTLHNIYYVPSIGEVCVEVNITEPVGLVSFLDSDITISKMKNGTNKTSKLDYKTCLWFDEGRLNMFEGPSSFVACSNGFGQDITPDDVIHINGQIRATIICSKFLHSCHHHEDETSEEMYTLSVKPRVIQDVIVQKERFIHPCSKNECGDHDCQVSCKTLLFGGKGYRCDGWWKTSKHEADYTGHIQTVQEKCNKVWEK